MPDVILRRVLVPRKAPSTRPSPKKRVFQEMCTALCDQELRTSKRMRPLFNRLRRYTEPDLLKDYGERAIASHLLVLNNAIDPADSCTTNAEADALMLFADELQHKGVRLFHQDNERMRCADLPTEHAIHAMVGILRKIREGHITLPPVEAVSEDPSVAAQ